MQSNTLPLVGLLQLVRPKQWIKNTFVLAPLVFAREFTDPQSIANALIAFGLFCIASSASYILNNIHDIERDRTHPVKRHSLPLAAGTVSIRSAVGLLVACYCVLVAGWFWPGSLAHQHHHPGVRRASPAPTCPGAWRWSPSCRRSPRSTRAAGSWRGTWTKASTTRPEDATNATVPLTI